MTRHIDHIAFRTDEKIALFLVAASPLITKVVKIILGDALPGSRSITLSLIAIFSFMAYRKYFKKRNVNNIRTKYLTKCCLLLGSLFVLMLFSLRWTPSPEYGWQKLQLFVPSGLLLPLSGYMLFSRRRAVPLFLRYSLMVMFGHLLFDLVIMNATVTVGNRLVAESGSGEYLEGSIAIARDYSYFLMVTFVYILYIRNMDMSYIPIKMLALAASVIMVAYMVGTGSRGPMLALAVGLVVFLWKYFGEIKMLLVAVMMFTLVLLSLPMIKGAVLSSTIAERTLRQIHVLNERGTVNEAIQDPSFRRIVRIGLAISEGGGLLGIGIGGFSHIYTGLDTKEYPHNIFVEIYSEMGFLGLGIICVLLVISFKRYFWGHTEKTFLEDSILLAFFVAGLVNASLSHHMAGNGQFWFWMAATWGSTNWLRSKDGEREIAIRKMFRKMFRYSTSTTPPCGVAEVATR